MASIHLKNIISKRNPASAGIFSFIDKISTDVSIEDNAGKILSGNNSNNGDRKYHVKADDEIIGWVKGDESASLVADLLGLLAEKESEKKRLGNEVLNLYREVNQIFNFSEKLAQSIGPQVISQTTLEEVGSVIKHDSSVIVLWNESSRRLEVIASKGELFFNEETISNHIEQLLKIILGGQSEILSDVASLSEAGIVSPDVKSIVYAALKVKHRVMGAIILASHEPNQYTAVDLKLLITFGLQSSAAIENALLYEKNIKEANERENVMRLFYNAAGKFVPHAFIDSLGHKLITDVKLGDQVEKIVTVLFTDIREFATLSEGMTPEANFSFICAFNEKMGPIIRGHNGFINQYLGDAIMAIFPGTASDAVFAAIDMRHAVKELNDRRHEKNYPAIQIGIGMHTGPLIMGITGDDERLDAATISDTVNTASRIESLTKYFKADILITEACQQQLNETDNLHLRPLGKVQVKGKREPISIHECFSGSDDAQLQHKLATLDVFREGIRNYQQKSFEKAFISFQQVLEKNPDDKPANFFLGKTARYISTGVSESWNGVEEMLEK